MADSEPKTPYNTWQERLAYVDETMRELSRQTDPQEMVRIYGNHTERINSIDRFVSLSRRGLSTPFYRITRSDLWKEDINPWLQKDRLPLLQGGLLGELIYSDAPRIINDLHIEASDPAAEYFADQGSLMAIPHYDGGVALNMVIIMRRIRNAFDPERLPDAVLTSNLFGRATHNLVLRDEARRAYDAVDREMRVVAAIQRSLLPAELPRIPTLDIAAYYETSTQAGGDYYDFFPLPDGRWGIFIADVTGHGTPAAVVMAITHAVAHTFPGPPAPPSRMLNYLNEKLFAHYTNGSGTFVTAFYGIYDPATRKLTYACAGHPPPRLKRCDDGTMDALDKVHDLPLGIDGAVRYEEAEHQLRVGDQIIFFTDGISEAFDGSGQQFGVDRLDRALGSCRPGAQMLIQAVLDSVRDFTAGRPADDDRTLLVAKVQ